MGDFLVFVLSMTGVMALSFVLAYLTGNVIFAGSPEDRNAYDDAIMALHDENAAFRRIMADQLRRGGCPDDLIDEAIDKAVRDA